MTPAELKRARRSLARLLKKLEAFNREILVLKDKDNPRRYAQLGRATNGISNAIHAISIIEQTLPPAPTETKP